MTKIAIIGLGGVGGYLGAKLAHKYENNEDIEIYFIARNAHLEAINTNGLRLITTKADFTTKPTLATSKAEECGKVDYIFYCTKSYDIINGIKEINSIISPQTVIIPILNGVDGTEKIRELLPNNIICDGLTYIISAIKEPGTVEVISDLKKYYFGDQKSDTPALKLLEKICQDAGIDIDYIEDIKYKVWDKFEFISCVASITTAYNITYYDVLNDEKYFKEFCNLIQEFDSVGYAKKALRFNENRTQNLIKAVKSLPSVATTSMQRDFWSGKNSETDSLTKYIIIEGEKLGIDTPQYKEVDRLYSENITKVK